MPSSDLADDAAQLNRDNAAVYSIKFNDSISVLEQILSPSSSITLERILLS